MKVPLLDLKEQNSALAGQLEAAFLRVLNSGQFILGSEVEELERATAVLTGAKYAIGVSSGTDAILLALMALGVKHGDEVICPSFTFFATAGCVARVGAKPVFADSCPTCFNLDVADAARRITPRTRAIIPVHLFGQAADMDGVMKLSRDHGIPVIEDAAQALGASYRGRKLGSIGDFGAFSFFPSKNLGGFGDGGLLVTNDDALSARARIMRTHGGESKYFHKVVGGNFRLDALMAALLSVKLPHLEEYTRRRQENAAYYTSALSAVKGVVPMPPCCGCGGKPESAPANSVLLPGALPHNNHIWNQYTLRVTGGAGWRQSGSPRDALRKFLSAREIGCETYYPQPMHLQECFASSGNPVERLPAAERLAAECLSIPIFPELGRQRQDQVIAAIGEFLEANLAA